MLGQILPPGRQGLGEFLLQLVRTAQQVAGLGHLLAVLVPLLSQELLKRRHRVLVTAPVYVALGNFQVGLAGQLVIRIPLDERHQCRGAQAQLLVVLRLRNLPRPRKLEGGLRDPLPPIGGAASCPTEWAGVGVLGQQVLPGPSRLFQLPFRQPALAQPVACLDVQRAVGVILDKLLKQARRRTVLLQVLLTLGHEQLHLGPLLGLRPHLQRLPVELQGLLVVRFVLFLGRLEVRVGELQIDIRDLLLPIGRKQILRLGPDDQLGAAKITLSGQRQCARQPAPAGPPTLGKILLQLPEDLRRPVVLFLQKERPALEVGQVVLRSVFGLGGPVDFLDGLLILPILHQLPDLLPHQRHIDGRLFLSGRLLIARRRRGGQKWRGGQHKKGQKDQNEWIPGGIHGISPGDLRKGRRAIGRQTAFRESGRRAEDLGR